MPHRASRRCAFPGCTQPGTPSRCTQHQAQQDAQQWRTTPTKAARTYPVRQHRAAAVKAHVAKHGWVCLGDQHHPPHATHDLVADDPIPIARHGDPMQPLVVMCRSANSRKGAR